MLLVESHIINNNKSLDLLTLKTKLLYNRANYIIRQEFINNGKYINKYDMFTLMKSDINYTNIKNARIARGILRILDANWKGFFKAIKSWVRSKVKFTGKPNLPHYLKKDHFVAIFMETSIRKPDKNGLIGLSQTDLKLNIKTENKIVEVQAKRLDNKKYKINIVYDYKEKELKQDNDRYCSIDLGLNNLMTVTSNDKGISPFIVNGRVLKSINQRYNKLKAKYQSELPKDVYTSKKITDLTFKRGNKMNDYLHKSSNYIVNYCLENNLNTLIVGYNQLWKKEINLGKRNNQNFVSIPFYKLIFMLEYKCLKSGIIFKTINESYTSKCSFIDHELSKKQMVYKGKRVNRGLFKSSKGLMINADVNASFNIMKKVVPDVRWDNGCAVHPRIVSF